MVTDEDRLNQWKTWKDNPRLVEPSITDPFKLPYWLTCNWTTDTFIQLGRNGIVGTKNGTYRTAFFEAFYKGKFFRGEGKTIYLAERDCWKQYVEYRKTHTQEEIDIYEQEAIARAELWKKEIELLKKELYG